MRKDSDEADARAHTPDATDDGERWLARVTVYGAGVTGLTAAHELVERGFKVRVVAPVEPGGSARTQYTHVHGGASGREAARLPGEQRSSYFPAYFRHVFDSMRRTPIYDDRGAQTQRTVLDNIIPTAARDDDAPALHNPLVTPRRAADPLSMARELARLIEEGYDWRDLQQFFLRIFRYLATSPARRAAELERLSWWEYLCGDDPDRGTQRYRYSDRFARDLKRAAQPLAAFDAEWGDARTCGSTYAQLLLGSLTRHDALEGALDGPISEAWFEPWRRHLERLGVEFVRGRLVTLRLDADGRARPYVLLGSCMEGQRPASADERGDYYVVATDAVTAELVSRELPARGVPGQLRGYTTRAPAKPRSRGDARAPGEVTRDPYTQPGLAPWDRLQTRAGIQYFFADELELPLGRLHLDRAEWALTTDDTSRRWRRSPRPRADGYAAALSVDIGAWSRPSRDPALAGRSAWQVSRRELAAEVWRQLGDALGEHAPALPQPTWFHIDEHIVYDSADGDDALPRENAAPLLLPIADDWRRRPGADPDDLAKRSSYGPRRAPDDPAIWSASPGGCWIHWGALVYAGSYKRTFTRLTTAESANESARHAVNAILDHLASTRADVGRPRDSETRERADSNTQRWRPSAAPLLRRCPIWNIEDHELPEFGALREQDALLLELGLPHPWELAGVETLPSLLSHMPGARAPDFAALRRLLEAARVNTRTTADRDPSRERPRAGAGPTPDLRASLEALHNIRQVVERELSRLFHRAGEND